MYMTGDPKQDLAKIPQWLHNAIHGRIDSIDGGAFRRRLSGMYFSNEIAKDPEYKRKLESVLRGVYDEFSKSKEEKKYMKKLMEIFNENLKNWY